MSKILTIAVISSRDWRNSTILDLWEGSTRAKQRAFKQASLCSDRLSSSNSRPVKAFNVTSSSCVKMPMRRQMATAVPLLSPVIMMTRMPACRHSFTEEATSILGGSSMPTQPTKVKLVCTKESPDLETGRFVFSPSEKQGYLYIWAKVSSAKAYTFDSYLRLSHTSQI